MKIMVLSDGETWGDLKGCTIMEVDHSSVIEAMQNSTAPKGKVVANFPTDGVTIQPASNTIVHVWPGE